MKRIYSRREYMERIRKFEECNGEGRRICKRNEGET